MLDKRTKELVKNEPYIKDMATLFTDQLTALDIYKAERFLNEQVALHGEENHRDIFINLRCYLEELNHNNGTMINGWLTPPRYTPLHVSRSRFTTIKD
jgi:hypothetical protein|tara:strand:- start:32 stop:325 length:294 start_codon:yes stop_codon:yes gene_type:complete